LNRCVKRVIQVGFLLLCAVPAWAQSNTPAPSVGLKDIKGHRFSLNEYKGKVVLVNFWATWCPPCRKEIPDFIRMQREYRDNGLQIIGITYPPQTAAEVRRFAKRLRMNYPVAIGTKAIKSRFTSSETLPVTVVIDREGRVRGVVEGIMYPDEFDQTVKPLLSVPFRQKKKIHATLSADAAAFNKRRSSPRA
jgi:cytochrome c biogenesis protein CcmG/thiol:disulfide interchange protein DsbE